MSGDSAVRIAVLLPDLLSTYGDHGNAIVLASRLRQRGICADVVEAPSHKAIPASCDLYLLGGGEDTAQAEAVRLLRLSRFPEAVNAGATVFAVCAGLQILTVDSVTAWVCSMRVPGRESGELPAKSSHARAPA